MIEAPASLIYSHVAVRIALMIVNLNGLNALACDIKNSFLTDKCREKCYTIYVPDFGSDRKKMILITPDLYGLKTSSASFRYYLADTLYELGYTPTKANPDVWIWKAV